MGVLPVLRSRRLDAGRRSNPTLSSRVTVAILQYILTQHSAQIIGIGPKGRSQLLNQIAHTSFLAGIPLVSVVVLACLIKCLEIATASSIIVVFTDLKKEKQALLRK